MGGSEHIVWADPKSRSNVETRKIDFADLDEAFDGRFCWIVEDRRRDYGERRLNMLAEIQAVILNITLTVRPPKHRIISARLPSRKERRLFHAEQQHRQAHNGSHGLGSPP